MSTALQADREQILAFRLAGHHLDARLPLGAMLEAAGACGLQNTPPGSAALALYARVAALTPSNLEQALAADKTLLQMRGMRGAPFVVSTAEAAVFTGALLPPDEPSLRFFIRGAEPALDRVGISGTDLVERTAAVVWDVLDGCALSLEPLGVEVARRLAGELTPTQARAWESPSPYAANQRLGEALVHFALYVVALRGSYCLAPRRGATTPFVRTDQWLGAPLPVIEGADASAELVRRYLGCYGPSTVEHFAEWAGIAPPHARRLWQRVELELISVQIGSRPAFLYRGDLARWEKRPPATGIRLLPPHDPYLAQRDRLMLVPDKSRHRQIWRTVGNPGVVLADGHLLGTWRGQKRGKRLQIGVELWEPLAPSLRDALTSEAQAVAPYRGCQSADVTIAP